MKGFVAMYRILLGCVFAVWLSGCGQTGPLYLPEEDSVPAPPDTVPPPPAAEQSVAPAEANTP